MNMQMSDKAKLEVEGAWFNPSSQPDKSLAWGWPVNNKGWYMGNVFIGHNYKEALDWLHGNGY